MAAATRTVTVIFTDLVGSTALWPRLDTAATDAMRDEHFGLLTAEATAVGGTVVKNLGDGLMIVFDAPTAALSAAVGMQQAVERHNRGAEEPLSMRVGIATGEATESDGDFFGDPVVEAARLCALAEGSQILATDLVRLVAGRHAEVEFVAVGALELKGLPDPVTAVEVGWEPIAEQERAQIPLPTRLGAGRGAAGFVGRAEELGEADRDAARGRRSAATPVGVGRWRAGHRQVVAGRRVCSPGVRRGLHRALWAVRRGSGYPVSAVGGGRRSSGRTRPT